MKSVSVMFLLLYFALGAIPQRTSTKGPIDIANLEARIQYLEQSLSHMESNAKTQEQKYAAVLSTVLSKLTTTTDELSNVKLDLNTLNDDHKAMKNELESTQEELRLLTDSAERNISICLVELERVRVDQNASGIAFTALGAAIVGLTSEVNVSKSCVTLIKSDVTSLRTEVDEVEKDLNSSHVVSETTQRKLEALSVKHEDTTNDVKKLQHDISNCQGQKNGNHVAFQAHVKETERVSSTLNFDRVDFNAGDSYNATTGMFTAPVNGTYLFWANVVFYEDLGVHNIYLHKEQQVLAIGFIILHHGENNVAAGLASVMTVVHLNRQDVVHFATDPTPSQVAGPGHSHYGGALLYAD